KFIERASQRYSTGISAGDRRQRGQDGARFDGGDQSQGAWMVKGDLFHSADALPDRPSGEFTLGDVQAVWSRALTPRSQLQLSSYLNHEHRRIPRQLTHRLTTLDLDAQQSITLERHAIVWGGGARVNKDSTEGSLISFDPADRTYRVNNLYVQDEVALKPRSVSITGGLKYERNAFSGGEWQPSVRAR